MELLFKISPSIWLYHTTFLTWSKSRPTFPLASVVLCDLKVKLVKWELFLLSWFVFWIFNLPDENGSCCCDWYFGVLLVRWVMDILTQLYSTSSVYFLWILCWWIFLKQKSISSLKYKEDKIKVREHRRGNKNGRSRETSNIEKQNKTQHNKCWTPLYANEHK